DPEKLQRKYPQIIIERLEKMGLHQLSHYIVTHEVFTAFDFEKRDNATLGSLYGHASNTPSSALFRPPLRSKLQKNLYFVGGTTHPGGGIPMVLLSAKMVTRMILEGTKA
ncbi:MAG: phytoene desaturase, partial [Verrucomicrobiae bacterium]|nr:phytoene desaturase [Verrucomicrobiae bacterium]